MGELRLFKLCMPQVKFTSVRGFGTEPKIALRLWGASKEARGTGALANKFGKGRNSEILKGGQLEKLSSHKEL